MALVPHATMRVMKTCGKCGRDSTEVDFAPTQKTLCKTCNSAYNREYHARNRAKILERQAEFRRAHPERVKAAQAKWVGKRTVETRECTRRVKYGLSSAKYAEMLAEQGGVCWICQQPPSDKHKLHVDHDHTCCPGEKSCGKCVRALLCNHCNRGLAAFMDDPALLKAAIKYLREFQRPV